MSSLVTTIKHNCIVCGKEFYCSKLISKDRCSKRKTCSNKCTKKIATTTFKKGHKQLNTGRTWLKKGLTPWNKGKVCPRGELANHWKGGLKQVNKAIRNSVEYKLWRTSIFIRDERTCVWCGSKERIEADHIKPFAFYPELRFALDNGRTLCRKCHETTDTYRRQKYD